MSEDVLPLWSPELPSGGARRVRPAPSAAPEAVYFPTCVNAMLGPAQGGIGVQRSFEELCERAGISVCDASSCTEGLLHAIAADTALPPLRVIDVVDFVAARILPTLPTHEKIDSLVLHPTCSSTRLGLNPHLSAIAGEVAEKVVVPDDWGCCAFAGDRGMLHPELTASATRAQAAEVRALGATEHASCNRTCELGMTRATGAEYRHVLELLAERTRGG